MAVQAVQGRMEYPVVAAVAALTPGIARIRLGAFVQNKFRLLYFLINNSESL